MLLLLVIALSLCAAPATGQGSSVCPGAPDVSCEAFSTLVIQTTSGSCSASSSSDCLAAANSQDSYVQAFRDWFGSGSDEQCTSGAIDSAAQAVAAASAQVWAAATSTVTCTSGGFACGFSVSNGVALSESMAEAVAQAAAEAGAGSAFCFADIRAVATVFAEAYATSKSEACTTGGTSESFSSAYAEEVKEGIASALASASAQSCQGKGGDASASSLCEGSSQSTGTFSAGDACAGAVTSREKFCEGSGRDKCCAANFRGIRCTCTGCNGPWFKTSGGSTPSFRDADGNSCVCPSTSIAAIETPPPPSPSPSPSPSPAVCDCDDVQPPGIFSCTAQKNYGKCEASWMTNGRYCRRTCGQCNCTPRTEVEVVEECSCVDVVPPVSSYSCVEQQFFGKCSTDWMIRNNWCEATCGRCSCPGAPEPPATPEVTEEIAPPPPEGCVCSDHPPPCKRFTCTMQKIFGKCEASWMLKTDVYPEGYCQYSCERCPCENPTRGDVTRPSCD